MAPYGATTDLEGFSQGEPGEHSRQGVPGHRIRRHTVLQPAPRRVSDADPAEALVPALQSTRSEVMETIRTEAVVAGRQGGRGRVSPRAALVVAQVAVSFVLLVTTGLFLRSFRERATVDPGFGRDPAVVVTLGLQGDRYTEAEGRLLVRRLEEHLAATPEISAVGVASRSPAIITVTVCNTRIIPTSSFRPISRTSIPPRTRTRATRRSAATPCDDRVRAALSDPWR